MRARYHVLHVLARDGGDYATVVSEVTRTQVAGAVVNPGTLKVEGAYVLVGR